jgi:hypothetical protein
MSPVRSTVQGRVEKVALVRCIDAGTGGHKLVCLRGIADLAGGEQAACQVLAGRGGWVVGLALALDV